MSYITPRLWRCSHRPWASTRTQRRCLSYDAVKEGDIVILKNVRSGISQPILTPPLVAGKKIKLQQDRINHDSVLGQPLSTGIVNTTKKVQYRIFQPTMSEYTNYSPRLVTPIYAQDANLIVSLLDLHPTLPGQSDDKLEIFEAGTGHGALTINLSRAIHAANTAPPVVSDVDDQTQHELYNQWISRRRAVIHTLDISESHSRHAQKTIQNFRGGMYLHNIQFHNGTIKDYLEPRIKSEEPFIDHAILDLPNTHSYMDIVSQAIKINGTMITFCPSITQINACLELVKEQDLPLFLETVLEIGGSVGVGGKEWDVRRVKVKSRKGPSQVEDVKLQHEDVSTTTGSESDFAHGSASEVDLPTDLPSAVITDIGAAAAADGESDGKWEMVCRPKVGVRVVGGGFVGLWRKKAP